MFARMVSVFIVAVLAGLWSFDGTAEGVLSINTTSSPPLATPEQDGYQDQIAIEVFRRLNREISIQYLPGERSLINLDTGVDDGTVVRIAGLGKSYANLRVVPEKFMDWQFMAFAKDPHLDIKTWDDLKSFSVAYINGWKIFENNVTQARHITKARNAKQLFELLQSKRAEVILFEKWSGLYILDQLGMQDVRGHILAKKEMFMYLHKKNAALIPGLASSLSDMKEDGTYDRIFERTLMPFSSK